MKLTLLTGISVVMIALSTTVFADKAHHTDKEEGAGQAMSGMMHSEGCMSMMDMGAMHGHMTKMQKTMDKIQGTEDIKQRQGLMQQHMQQMHQGMGMMQCKVSDEMSDKMKTPMAMIDKDDAMPGVNDMMKRHKMMEQRMDMMQGMMGQMMEHMMQQQNMGMEKK